MNFEVEHQSILAGNPHVWALLVWRRDTQRPLKRTSHHSRDTRSWRFCLGWVSVHFCTFARFGHRTRRGKERLARFALALKPWPVHVAYSSYCCDTGRFFWAERFPHGFAAWKATTRQALDGGDGPTGYIVLTEKEDIEYYFPPPCEHDYGDYSRHCGAQVCWKCGDHKGLARCYCGWSASGGNGYQELVGLGETI